MRPVRIGCSGWQYRDWRGPVYPKGLAQRNWLTRYAELFDTVEVNSTFYRLARRDAVARWVEQTPPGFTFAVKASRFMTHSLKLVDLDRPLRRFREPIEPLIDAGRLGPVLWQLPPWFERDLDKLVSTLALCDELLPGHHAWEFRHPSWFTDDTYEILRVHGAALAYGDTPARRFGEHVRTADWSFVRFHYGERGRRGNYSKAELGEWAERLAEWARDEALWVYFNNDWEAFAPRNAHTLRADLERMAA